MARLSIWLLGTFRVQLDGEDIGGFRTNKARALLAYLVVEAGRVHQRAHLAGLLWPDWPESQARTYLRQALSNLQRTLSSAATLPFCLTTRHTIQLNPDNDTWVDVTFLSDTLSTLPSPGKQIDDPTEQSQLEKAVALYQGGFLEGFFLPGCAAFEEWQLLTAEQLRRQVVAGLDHLMHWHAERGRIASAQRHAWKRVELEPFAESGHRQLMMFLAQAGEINAAIAHFQQYRSLLAEELGTSPSPTTIELVNQIKAGQIRATSEAEGIDSRGWDDLLPLPAFLSALPTMPRDDPVFANREPELAQLQKQLVETLAGRGTVVLVSGDAGMGKTALVQEFTKRAQIVHADLAVARGACCSHRGIGDPYLPFRDILAQLTGNLEASWTAGEVSRNQAQRLWSLFPHTVEALLREGRDLIGLFVEHRTLLNHLEALPGSQDLLAELADSHLQDLPSRPAPGPSQPALFNQWTSVLKTVAQARPLLLWLDDLQWGDLDSIALLFHLGQRLAGSRVLITGGFRPVEVAIGRDGRRHPLKKVINELQKKIGAVVVDLNRSDGRRFVSAFLETEPNSLCRNFRDTLYRQSGGNPLFIVELIQNLRARGDLIRDSQGRWIEGENIDWNFLPTRVEAVIAERMDRMPDDLYQVLAAASVQGEHFTAEVIADVLACDSRHLIQQLSVVLDRQHRMVVARGIQRVNEKRLATYRFRHELFQRFVYDNLDAVERCQLHEDVAASLAHSYRHSAGGVAPIAAQLAWHYREAGHIDKAVLHLLQAGNEAVRLSAYDEARARFAEGLTLMHKLSRRPEKQVMELKLLMGLGAVQAMTKGDAEPETEQIFVRAQRLCRQVRDSQRLFETLWRLWHCQYQRGNLHKALQLGQECLGIAETNKDPAQLVRAKAIMGSTFHRFGQFCNALDELSAARSLCATGPADLFMLLDGLDPEVQTRAVESQVLWSLGFSDQALASSQEALATVKTRGHPYSHAFALIFAAGLHQRRCDAAQTAIFADKTVRLSRNHGFRLWEAAGILYRGWAFAVQGDIERGTIEVQQGYHAIHATGMNQVRYGAVLADVYRVAGRCDQALSLVEEQLRIAQRTDEREWEAELLRMQGELLLNRDGSLQAGEAAGCFRRAIEVARQQEAKSLELRATVSLCRLLVSQGKTDDSTRLLQRITGWFTEGVDAPDFKAAQTLLAAPAQQA